MWVDNCRIGIQEAAVSIGIPDPMTVESTAPLQSLPDLVPNGGLGRAPDPNRFDADRLFSVGCTHSALRPKAAARSPSWRRRAATTTLSDLSLLRNLERVIDLDPTVSHGTFQLGVATTLPRN